MTHLIKTKPRGQGLMEMIFAIGILLLVVSAVLGIATANVVGHSASELQITANNLAREGIEVARSIRDTNWIAGNDWDSGLVGTGNFALAHFDAAANDWQLEFFTNDPDELLYVTSAGVYSHDDSGQPTVFRRTLILQSICIDSLSFGAEEIKVTCDLAEQKIGLHIRSVVRWDERGRQRIITLEDLLYDWK